MTYFFSDELGQSLEMFGLAHIFLLLGFFTSIVLFWIFSPKLRGTKYEKWVRYSMLVLVILFEWNVFENRILNGSIFRMPLCAISLYGLTYSVIFKNKTVFKVIYFYSFGTLLSFVFFDTPWGLDKWEGWKFFGAHAMIAYLAVYGNRVLDFKIFKKDLYISMGFLAVYAFISGYATYKTGGSDELFLKNPPEEFLNFLVDIHQIVYVIVFCILAALLMLLMYFPMYLSNKSK